MRTTAYLKAIMEVYGKTITDLGPEMELAHIRYNYLTWVKTTEIPSWCARKSCFVDTIARLYTNMKRVQNCTGFIFERLTQLYTIKG